MRQLLNRGGIVALVLLVAPWASAQTNDLYFRGWTWTPDAGAARAMGMGGAGVALPDDVASLEANPASLASIERTQVTLAVAQRGAGHTSASDRVLARSSLTHLGVAARLGIRWAAGVYVSEPQASRTDIDTTIDIESPVGVGMEKGHLDAVTNDVGCGLAMRIGKGLSVGGRLTLARLTLESEYSFSEAQVGMWRVVGSAGEPQIVLGAVGVHWATSRKLHLGVAFAEGGAWELQRRDISPVMGLNLASGTSFVVQRPSVLSAGLAWSPTYRLTVVAQMERMGFGSLHAVPPESDEIAFPTSAWRERVGVEYSWPFRSLAIQARLGVIWSGQLPDLGDLFSGSEPMAAGFAGPAAYPDAAGGRRDGIYGRSDGYGALANAAGDWATHNLYPIESPKDEPTALTAGASIVMSSGASLDLALRASSLRVVGSVGFGVRF